MTVEQKDEKEFTISDRRSVPAEETTPAQEESSKQQSDAPGQKPADTAQPQGQKAAAPLPELDFASFLLSLATTAQLSLGTIPNPQSGKTEQNLPAAKQIIDILGIVKEKTKNNLSKEEELLLDSALFNLRMHYIRAADGEK